MNLISLRVVVVTLLLLAAACAPAHGGQLDPTFGTNGSVSQCPAPGSRIVFPERIIPATDDGFFLVGGAARCNSRHSDELPPTLAVRKFLSDGVVDVTWGRHGYAAIPMENWHFDAWVGPDGSLSMGLESAELNSGPSRDSMEVVRLTADGRPDTTWGKSGRRVILEYRQELDDPMLRGDISFGPDGSYVAALPVITRSRLRGVRVWSFGPEGSPRPGFPRVVTRSQLGLGTFDPERDYEESADATVMLDATSGQIYVAVTEGPTGLARISADGAYDPTLDPSALKKITNSIDDIHRVPSGLIVVGQARKGDAVTSSPFLLNMQGAPLPYPASDTVAASGLGDSLLIAPSGRAWWLAGERQLRGPAFSESDVAVREILPTGELTAADWLDSTSSRPDFESPEPAALVGDRIVTVTNGRVVRLHTAPATASRAITVAYPAACPCGMPRGSRVPVVGSLTRGAEPEANAPVRVRWFRLVGRRWLQWHEVPGKTFADGSFNINSPLLPPGRWSAQVLASGVGSDAQVVSGFTSVRIGTKRHARDAATVLLAKEQLGAFERILTLCGNGFRTCMSVAEVRLPVQRTTRPAFGSFGHTATKSRKRHPATVTLSLRAVRHGNLWLTMTTATQEPDFDGNVRSNRIRYRCHGSRKLLHIWCPRGTWRPHAEMDYFPPAGRGREATEVEWL